MLVLGAPSTRGTGDLLVTYSSEGRRLVRRSCRTNLECCGEVNTIPRLICVCKSAVLDSEYELEPLTPREEERLL